MKYLTLIALLLLLACKEEPVKNPAPKEAAAAETGSDGKVETGGDECPSDIAHPVIKRSVYPKAVFELQADARTGIETATLSNGDQLTITYSGCEYVSLSFKFERMDSSIPSAPMEGYLNVIDFMTRLIPAIDAPLSLEDAVMTLTRHIAEANAKAGEMRYDEEIPISEGDIQTIIVVNAPEKLNNGGYAQEFVISIGPL